MLETNTLEFSAMVNVESFHFATQTVCTIRGGFRIYKRGGERERRLTQGTNLSCESVQSMLELACHPPPKEIFEKSMLLQYCNLEKFSHTCLFVYKYFMYCPLD